MKYVAWYTEGTVYEDIFHTHLEPTLKEYDLDSHIVVMPNKKRWGSNVAQKPLVVLETLKALQEPFVLLDVDCKITAKPTLFDEIDPTKYDIAYHTLDWETWYNRPGREHNKELLTGTMWFNATDDVLQMIYEWHTVCFNNHCADQPPFAHLMKNKYRNLRVYDLPLEYCYINSMPDGREPFVKVDKPVITHYQASRDKKRGEL